MAEEFVSYYDFYIQQAAEKAMQKGMEKGMEKGRENEKVALILKASLEGLSLNLISRIVDLTEEEVAAIIRKQQKQ